MKENQHIGMIQCPFCTGHYSAGDNPPTVAHSLPPCLKWIDLEPEEYLCEARLAREAKNSLS